MAIFRVFISSTFNDFQCERWVLQHIVFPRLKEKCQQHGAEFLGVDLRWGISPERSSRSKTIQTCFDEIERCQRLSPKPNFVLLLGQRYGYIPLPEVIPNSLYCKIRDFFIKNIESEPLLLWDNWYQQDSNDLERKWLIKPHDGCNGYTAPSLQEALKNALKRATESLELNLSEGEKCLLTGSATEQEIQKGIFDQAGSSDHVFVWRRVISDLPFSGEEACLYRDSGEDSYNHVSGARLEVLAGKLKSLLGERYLEHNVRLSELSSTVTQAVDEVQLTSYLRNFADTMEKQLWAKIEEQIRDEPSQDEEYTHRQFARLRSEGIVGREAELEEIHKYLESKPAAPYFIKAPGGMGKTSLLAKAVTDVLPQFRERNHLVRFVGASSNIGTPTSLLLSLWPNKKIEALVEKVYVDEKCSRDFLRDYLHFFKAPLPITRPQWSKELQNAIKEEDIGARREGLINAATFWRNWLISEITAGSDEPREDLFEIYIQIIQKVTGDSLILVIDALDQLEGYPDLNYLFYRLTDRTYKRAWDNRLWIILTSRDATGTSLKGLDMKAWNAYVENFLSSHRRGLTPIQRNWLNQVDQSQGNPLVLKLASEYTLRLTSHINPTGSTDLSSCIERLYEFIGGKSEHGLLGEKVLQYLAISRLGIPEDVLLKALASDNDIHVWFSETYPHHSWSLDNGLPPILWSRIQMDLEPYLVRKDVFGSQALNFFHLEFKNEALGFAKKQEDFDFKSTSHNLACIAWNQLTGKDYDPYDLSFPIDFPNKQSNGWSISELPWLLEQSGHAGLSKQLLSDVSFVLAKIQYQGGVESLLDDYNRFEDSEWSTLIKCHYQQLILSQNPHEVWIQAARQLPVSSAIRLSTEEWLDLTRSSQYRLKDLLPQAKPDAQILVGKNAFQIEELDERRIVVCSSSDYLKIIEPDNPLGSIKYLKHISTSRGAPANFGKLVQLCNKDFLVVYYQEQNPSKSPELVVWDVRGVPKKICELSNEEHVLDIIGETPTCFLVKYSNDLVGRWDLSNLILDAPIENPRQILSTNDSHFTELGRTDVQICDPTTLREPSLFAFSCLDGVHVRTDTLEKVFDVDGCIGLLKRIGPNKLLDVCDNKCYVLELDSGSVDSISTGGRNLDALARKDDFLILRPNGVLQTLRSGQNTTQIKPSFVTELPNGDVLACSEGKFFVFQSDLKGQHRTVWTAINKNKTDHVRAACTAEHGRLITFGDDYIRLWETNEQEWLLIDEYHFPGLCSKRALTIGDHKYLLEFGRPNEEHSGTLIPGQGTHIAIVNVIDDEFTVTSLPLGSEEYYFSLQIPPLKTGEVLFLATPTDWRKDTHLVEFDLNLGQSQSFRNSDQALQTWMNQHESALRSFNNDLINTLKAWTRNIAISGKPLSDYISFYEDSISLETLSGPPITLPKDCAIATDAYLGRCSLKDISIFDSNNNTIASYLDSGNFRLWVNQLDSSGRLYLTDANNNLVVLQLTKGTLLTALPQ